MTGLGGKKPAGRSDPSSRRLIRENLAKESSNDPTKNKGNNDVSEDFGNIKKPLKKCISENEEKWVLLEKVAFPLPTPWNKRYIRVAQALVEKTQPVILSRQLSGPQVKAPGGGPAQGRWGRGEGLSKRGQHGHGRQIGYGTTTNFLIDSHNLTGYAQVVDELQGNTVNTVYSYGTNRISEDLYNGTSWNLSYYGYDGQGSVRYMTNSSGTITNTYDYDAFGTLINQTHVGTATPSEFLYDGEQGDSNTNFYNLRARWMNPGIGRFQTMDMEEGDQENPLTPHKYIFCSNNPVDEIDPSGNEDLEITPTINVITVRIPQGFVVSCDPIKISFFDKYYPIIKSEIADPNSINPLFLTALGAVESANINGQWGLGSDILNYYQLWGFKIHNKLIKFRSVDSSNASLSKHWGPRFQGPSDINSFVNKLDPSFPNSKPYPNYNWENPNGHKKT